VSDGTVETYFGALQQPMYASVRYHDDDAHDRAVIPAAHAYNGDETLEDDASIHAGNYGDITDHRLLVMKVATGAMALGTVLHSATLPVGRRVGSMRVSVYPIIDMMLEGVRTPTSSAGIEYPIRVVSNGLQYPIPTEGRTFNFPFSETYTVETNFLHPVVIAEEVAGAVVNSVVGFQMVIDEVALDLHDVMSSNLVDNFGSMNHDDALSSVFFLPERTKKTLALADSYDRYMGRTNGRHSTAQVIFPDAVPASHEETRVFDATGTAVACGDRQIFDLSFWFGLRSYYGVSLSVIRTRWESFSEILDALIKMARTDCNFIRDEYV
jgi:hypothetical protein